MRNQSDFEIDIYFIRHGKTRFNEERKYIGRCDLPLSDNGKKEIVENKNKGFYVEAFNKSEKVFVSPMKRAVESAEIIFGDNFNFCIKSGFREMDFGDFEGKTYEDLKENPEYIEFIASNGSVSPKGGEDINRVKDRIKKSFTEMLYESRSLSGVSIVAHGGTIMNILKEFGGGDFYEVFLKNGEGVKLNVHYSIMDNEDIIISCVSVVNRFCS